jgi:hypothetical protein
MSSPDLIHRFECCVVGSSGIGSRQEDTSVQMERGRSACHLHRSMVRHEPSSLQRPFWLCHAPQFSCFCGAMVMYPCLVVVALRQKSVLCRCLQRLAHVPAEVLYHKKYCLNAKVTPFWTNVLEFVVTSIVCSYRSRLGMIRLCDSHYSHR